MAVKTDIEIAQEAKMLDIRKVAAKAGITNEDDLELYGKYKAKISDEAAKALEKNEDGKLILSLIHISEPTRVRRQRQMCIRDRD